jgi:hypothetical protein
VAEVFAMPHSGPCPIVARVWRQIVNTPIRWRRWHSGRKSSSVGKVSMNTPYSQAFGDSISVTFLVSFCASDFARSPEEVDLLPLSWTKHTVNPLPEA